MATTVSAQADERMAWDAARMANRVWSQARDRANRECTQEACDAVAMARVARDRTKRAAEAASRVAFRAMVSA